ncbi:hypothetical protein [Arthrobacter glacialis]|uniref:hypothetical protein n=1 Tax=Arthrobacter glacialis TaxID=1664 RepID=UPI0013FD5937|nr:hypothetical protein [Arthrobacter glacialis]
MHRALEAAPNGTNTSTKLENRVAAIPEMAATLQGTIADKRLVTVEIDAQLGREQ